jgi:hypothetical protein
MSIPIGIAYSPKTKLNSGLDELDDECVVVNINAFPTPPAGGKGVVVFCSDDRFDSDDPNDYETCYYTGRDVGSSKLTGLDRGVEGNTPATWPAETACACLFTNAHWEAMRKNAIYGNWDGGKPDTNYGGMNAIDGGGV